MLSRHYAPRTPLECVPDGRERVVELVRQGRRVGWLTHQEGELAEMSGVLLVRMPAEPAGYAAVLYDTLHRLDAAGLDRIVVTSPPEEEDWLGVRDRLRRAAEPGG
jgi:L-threonylcarbamoyladenylate synthase